ncbi:hypothetical protein PHG11b_32 [Flavobacterium phage 11b]|jgi:hypothetical protein|uniref:hypothetical protein n=1 Tax=Flavobacterium phage 11b TaxID=294631 RepID=UPI000044413E|nr:hypothetical protein PHG11b_32 [Flavobacterium phage 11b]CAH56659.1 hypothetical protein PHG11b_32 [Flavobacterium phage 11b]
MAVRKVIQVAASGTQSEYAGLNASAGAGSAGDFIIAASDGKLDPTFLPTGTGADSITATAGEGLSAGDFVYISGTGTVLKADATTPAKAARGYVLSAVLNAALATVFFDDSNTSLSALTPGATYYLSSTAGLAALSPPTTAGQIVQQIGFATSATSLHVNIQELITRA